MLELTPSISFCTPAALTGLIIGIIIQHFYPSLLAYQIALIIVTTIIWLIQKIFEGEIWHLLALTIFLVCNLFGSLCYLHTVNKFEQCYNQMTRDACSISGIIGNIEQTKTGKTRIAIVDTIVESEVDKKRWGTIHAYSHQYINACLGDHIKIVKALLKKPTNESYCRYLIKEGVCAAIFISPKQLYVTKRSSSNIAKAIYTIKMRLLELSQATTENQYASYIFSRIFLGYHGNLPQQHSIISKEFQKNCMEWGISHYLARSGLHLIIFIIIWHFILKLIPAPFLFKQIVLLFLCGIYHAFSWQSTSFLRALYLFFINKICIIGSIRTNPLHVLSLITIAFLIYNPLYLFYLDFQLSFGMTYALIWYNQIKRHKVLILNS